MKTSLSLLFLFLFVFSEISLAAAYKVQVYNGTGQTITIYPGYGGIDRPIDFGLGCKWANTNFNMGNITNWSSSTRSAWADSIFEKRAIQPGKHRALWCVDRRPKRWERRFGVYVGCNPPDGPWYRHVSQTYERNHLNVYSNYVFSLDGSHCIPTSTRHD